MAYVRNPVVYVPDLTNGRPIVDGKVYLLTSGTIPPMHDSTIDPLDLLTVTFVNEAGNTVEQPQPLYTSKGGCLYGNFPDAARQFMIAPQAYVFAAYNRIGELQYSAETSASDYVETDALAAVGSTVLIGGEEAGDVGKTSKAFTSIYEFMTDVQYSAIIGGDTNQDITAAVQAALTSGAKRVSFAGVVAICDIVILSGVANLDIDGAGAKLRKPAGSGQNSQIFRILGGSSDIELHDFAELDGGYYSTNATTGTRPVIMIGDESGAGDGGLTNKNIKIYRNTIKGSNWGGIVVYGRSNTAVTLTPKNQNISIFNNVIYDCGGNGVFVYKNAYDVRVYHNEIYDLANNGIVFDTMAQSDAVTTEPNYQIQVYGNRIYNLCKKGSGAGVQIKGRNYSFAVRDNEIFNAVSDGVSNQNYGVFVTRDNALARPYSGLISGNSIYTLTAFGTAVGIAVLGSDAVKVIGNTVFDTKSQGIQASLTNDLKVLANDVANAGASVYGYSFIGDVSNRIVNLKCIGNTYKKGAGTSTGGFNYTYVDGLDSHCNDAVDFTTTAELFSNCTTIDFLNQVTQAGAPSVGLQLQGLRQNETSPGLTNPVVQRVNISTGSPGIYRPSSWIVGRNVTGSRPTLTSSDVGVMYLDNTLDADGKPIWWNGTAWVDATGAVV